MDHNAYVRENPCTNKDYSGDSGMGHNANDPIDLCNNSHGNDRKHQYDVNLRMDRSAIRKRLEHDMDRNDGIRMDRNGDHKHHGNHRGRNGDYCKDHSEPRLRRTIHHAINDGIYMDPNAKNRRSLCTYNCHVDGVICKGHSGMCHLDHRSHVLSTRHHDGTCHHDVCTLPSTLQQT